MDEKCEDSKYMNLEINLDLVEQLKIITSEVKKNRSGGKRIVSDCEYRRRKELGIPQADSIPYSEIKKEVLAFKRQFPRLAREPVASIYYNAIWEKRTGVPILEKLGGIEPRDFILFCGLTGQGGTLILTTIAANLIKQKIPVHYFFFNDPGEQLIERIAMEAINVRPQHPIEYLTGECSSQLYEAVDAGIAMVLMADFQLTHFGKGDFLPLDAVDKIPNGGVLLIDNLSCFFRTDNKAFAELHKRCCKRNISIIMHGHYDPSASKPMNKLVKDFSDDILTKKIYFSLDFPRFPDPCRIYTFESTKPRNEKMDVYWDHRGGFSYNG
jgi:hypothetical protein